MNVLYGLYVSMYSYIDGGVLQWDCGAGEVGIQHGSGSIALLLIAYCLLLSIVRVVELSSCAVYLCTSTWLLQILFDDVNCIHLGVYKPLLYSICSIPSIGANTDNRTIGQIIKSI